MLRVTVVKRQAHDFAQVANLSSCLKFARHQNVSCPWPSLCGRSAGPHQWQCFSVNPWGAEAWNLEQVARPPFHTWVFRRAGELSELNREQTSDIIAMAIASRGELIIGFS